MRLQFLFVFLDTQHNFWFPLNTQHIVVNLVFYWVALWGCCFGLPVFLSLPFPFPTFFPFPFPLPFRFRFLSFFFLFSSRSLSSVLTQNTRTPRSSVKQTVPRRHSVCLIVCCFCVVSLSNKKEFTLSAQRNPPLMSRRIVCVGGRGPGALVNESLLSA